VTRDQRPKMSTSTQSRVHGAPRDGPRLAAQKDLRHDERPTGKSEKRWPGEKQGALIWPGGERRLVAIWLVVAPRQWCSRSSSEHGTRCPWPSVCVAPRLSGPIDIDVIEASIDGQCEGSCWQQIEEPSPADLLR